MIEIVPLSKDHFEGLYQIEKHWWQGNTIRFDQFCALLSRWEGLVFLDKGKVISGVGLSDFEPNCDVIMHCSAHPDYLGKWVSKRALRAVFGLVFHDLKLPRASSFSIPGITDLGAIFLFEVGFTYEGRKRKRFLLNGQRHDIWLFGMLKEECRWIR